MSELLKPHILLVKLTLQRGIIQIGNIKKFFLAYHSIHTGSAHIVKVVIKVAGCRIFKLFRETIAEIIKEIQFAWAPSSPNTVPLLRVSLKDIIEVVNLKYR